MQTKAAFLLLLLAVTAAAGADTVCPCVPTSYEWIVTPCETWECAASQLVLAGGDPFDLATIGVRRDSLVLPSLNRDAVYLDLYDLSDTVRLQSANAESFPVSPMSKNPRPGCRPWTKPSPLDSLR